MRDLLPQAVVAGRAVEVRRDNVPGEPPLAEMVHRGQAARQRVGLLVGDAGGHAKDEVPRPGGHGRDEVERIVDGELRARRQRRLNVGGPLVHIIRSEGVCDEHGVEVGLVEQLCQVRPEGELCVVCRVVFRMPPEPGRQMPGCVHDKGIQNQFLFGINSCSI